MAAAEKYPILVIGSGGSGKFIGWTMARAGNRTAVVERKYFGGACPNIACLPSKNIIYSAKVAATARRAGEFGVNLSSLKVDMAAVQQRKRKMVEGLIEMHYGHQKASGAELIWGEARFIAPQTVEVALKDGGTRTIFGEKVFIDVGSRATLPNVPGLADSRPMTHIELLDLERLPEHLIVMGGGYVGLELSQAMRRFGARVTIIEHGAQLAPREDPDIGDALLELFRDEGIEVLLNASVIRVEGTSGKLVRVHTKDAGGVKILEGTDLLAATGRTPNTDRLGLEKAGIALAEHGFIKVDEHLRTTAPNVWAMGDCAGSPQFTHVAFDDFRVVHSDLTGGHRTTRNRLVPFCMFTDPELARVGRNEIEARRDGLDYRLAKLPIGEILRTRTVSERRGIMKMLIAKSSDEILGFTAFGFDASELMAVAQTAMAGKLPYTVLRDALFTHPTISEGFNVMLGEFEAA